MKLSSPVTTVMAAITGVLFLIPGSFASLYAQQDNRHQNSQQQTQGQQTQGQQTQGQQTKSQHRQQQQTGVQQGQQSQGQPGGQQHQTMGQPGGQQHQTMGQPGGQQHQSMGQQGGQQHQSMGQPGGQQHQSMGQPGRQQHQSMGQPGRQQNQSMGQPGNIQAKRQHQQAQFNRPSQQVEKVQRGEMHNVWQQHRAKSWQTEHRTWHQRGGYNGYRITDNIYRGNFGQAHRFRMSRLSLELFDGQPSFQYNGYWFSIIDPWPESWSNNWYDNDDVYIAYNGDGYYLFNRRHPRIGVALNVYLN